MKLTTRGPRMVLGGGITAALLLLIGALGSRLGFWPFTVGFLFLMIGVVVAVLTTIAGSFVVVSALRRTGSSNYLAPGIGVGVCVLVMLVIGGQFVPAASLPPIHNISTDLEDPPQFEAIVPRRSGLNPHRYDAAQKIGDAGTLGDLQRAAYPELKTLRSAVSVLAGLERTVAILEDMGLEVVAVDRVTGRVEATATTFWFGFKDDVVVRLKAAGGVTSVDVHSVSRVGQGDLGVNARRIATFLSQFAAMEREDKSSVAP